MTFIIICTVVAISLPCKSCSTISKILELVYEMFTNFTTQCSEQNTTEMPVPQFPYTVSRTIFFRKWHY